VQMPIIGNATDRSLTPRQAPPPPPQGKVVTVSGGASIDPSEETLPF
jgi:hypothetical protein